MAITRTQKQLLELQKEVDDLLNPVFLAHAANDDLVPLMVTITNYLAKVAGVMGDELEWLDVCFLSVATLRVSKEGEGAGSDPDKCAQCPVRNKCPAATGKAPTSDDQLN